MNKEMNYLSTWKDFVEEAGIDYESNEYLEEYWDKSQDKLFAFVFKLLF